jgi:hypothetical protein
VTDAPALVIAAAGAGIIGGLFLLVRGMAAFRAGEAVRGTSTSRIESLAADEVRLVGTIAPGPVTLVSALQSAPCVYYHARIVEDRGRERTTTLDEERAVRFLLHDDTGALHIFPRGAHWDAPTCFDEQTDWAGDDPPGLDRNHGSGMTTVTLDRDAAIEALLTVHRPDGSPADDEPRGILGGVTVLGTADLSARRHYEERRLAPGDVVTIVAARSRSATSRIRQRPTGTIPPVRSTTRRWREVWPRPARRESWRTPRRTRGETRQSPASGSDGRRAPQSCIPRPSSTSRPLSS